MSPTYFSCVICGYVICDHGEDLVWLKQFRILYSSPDGIGVTGVGVYEEPDLAEWIAPSNFSARWDDAGYGSPASDQIGVLQQPAYNNKHGFPFHEACWSLLEKAYYSEPIPIDSLFEVCRSLPFPSEGTGLDWGHDYGGLIIVDEEHRYPWEERAILDKDDLNSHSDDELSVSEENSVECNDPFCVPEIEHYPLKSPQPPPASSSLGLVSNSSDCFMKLPEEIRFVIAINSSTADILNLRRASRSFLSTSNSQSFWASRFSAYGERSWLFESQKWAKAQDWRWLYHRTNKAHRPKGLRNRERIWKLIEHVQKILRLQWTEGALNYSLNSKLLWSEATGDLRPEGPNGLYELNEGCRQFRECIVPIPSVLSRITFSMVQLGDTEFVAGLRLSPSEGETIELGYWKGGREYSLNLTCLTGFNLAVGSRGIQGIQCIAGETETIPWVGCLNGAPITKRLTASAQLSAIKAGFDGCKMVSLAVAKSDPSVTGVITEAGESLRKLALWYPQVPGINLNLHEEDFIARDISTTRYQPLCWTLFGGPGGIYLRYLTGLSVSSLGAIEFHYNNDDVPIECRKMGRYSPIEYDPVTHFLIDGPGGEIISGVETHIDCSNREYVAWYYKAGSLRSFRIFTNRGRSCHFGPDLKAHLVGRSVRVAAGTTINGFYWTQNRNQLTALGVISELIEERQKETPQRKNYFTQYGGFRKFLASSMRSVLCKTSSPSDTGPGSV